MPNAYIFLQKTIRYTVYTTYIILHSIIFLSTMFSVQCTENIIQLYIKTNHKCNNKTTTITMTPTCTPQTFCYKYSLKTSYSTLNVPHSLFHVSLLNPPWNDKTTNFINSTALSTQLFCSRKSKGTNTSKALVMLEISVSTSGFRYHP